MINEQADVVIVGSGASGSALAAGLAQAGKKVLILEAGPDRNNSDLISSGIWSRRLKWGGAPVLESGKNPVGHAFNAGFGVGGSAMHHYAVWPRLHETDFRCYSEFEEGLDWPIEYSELRPYYDQVQTEVGVSGDSAKETWRPSGAPYPLPPVPVFEQGNIIARGFSAQGMHCAPLPLAVTSKPYKGRPACIWDGWCDAGCPIGALANPLTVYLPQAIAAGAVMMTDATVTKVLTNTSGEKATGVEVALALGEKMTVDADVVVLAAFAIQNPRLLLASANDKHPSGLANTSDQVGRYIMSHSAGLIYGLFEEETHCYMGAFGGQLVNQDSYGKTTHEESGAFGSYQWMIAQAVKPNDLLGISTTRPDLFGDDLNQFMHKAAKHFASMTAVVEDLPLAENRLTLGEDKDNHGVPLAQVVHTSHEKSNLLWRATLEEGKGRFRIRRCQRSLDRPPRRDAHYGGDHYGGGPIGRR